MLIIFIFSIAIKISSYAKAEKVTTTTFYDDDTQVDDVNSLCEWIDDDRKCPDSEIRFYLFTRLNIDDMQLINIDDSWEKSNLSASNFNPRVASKILIHGFRSDMFLEPLYQMKNGNSFTSFMILLIFHHFLFPIIKDKH
jgi:hypothetical protein